MQNDDVPEIYSRISGIFSHMNRIYSQKIKGNIENSFSRNK